MPELDIPEHTLSSYDEILVGTPERACAGNGSASGVETVKLPQFRTISGELSLDNTPQQLHQVPRKSGAAIWGLRLQSDSKAMSGSPPISGVKCFYR